jgi:phosphatidylethanolamine-binding protein (PEBP) family uncharacterized protein
MKLSSLAFAEGELIPSKYTCDGENVSPPLEWEGVPEQAKSLALIVDDPDAPSGVFVHWLLFRIPPSEKVLTEARVRGVPKVAFMARTGSGRLPTAVRVRRAGRIAITSVCTRSTHS